MEGLVAVKGSEGEKGVNEADGSEGRGKDEVKEWLCVFMRREGGGEEGRGGRGVEGEVKEWKKVPKGRREEEGGDEGGSVKELRGKGSGE